MAGGGSKLVKSNLPRSKFPFIFGGGGSKLVKSNLPRSKFPFILGGVQSWSSQICLDLNFPLFWGGSKLVKLNLPRSKFPFILGGGFKVGQVKSVIKKIFLI